jgi:TRAP-type C4-dicarboxylate transport system substrate-binding protein
MGEKNIAMVLMVAFLLGISSLYTPVQAQIKLTYANSAPTGTFPSVQMERWAKEVEKRTSGKSCKIGIDNIR